MRVLGCSKEIEDLMTSSKEAEIAVLGRLLTEGDSLKEALFLLDANDFGIPRHKLIYQGILSAAKTHGSADVLSVYDALLNAGVAVEAKELAYLNEIAQKPSSGSEFMKHANIIKNKAVLRSLLRAADEISYSALNPQNKSTEQLIGEAEAILASIKKLNSKRVDLGADIKSTLNIIVDRVGRANDSKNCLVGISTGFPTLDNITLGLQGGELIVIAGRPSMGKTAFAMNLAEHVALIERRPVAIFSMEMPISQLLTRMVGSVGIIKQRSIRTGDLRCKDWSNLLQATKKVGSAHLAIDDDGSLTSSDIRNKLLNWTDVYGKFGLVVIDYIQLMTSPTYLGNRSMEIAEISRSLKNLSKELDVPVIAISQLNRSLEQRTDKRPIMADLRESGAIEQDADLILFVYRDEVYNPGAKAKGLAEIIIGKHRNGPTGSISLNFLGDYIKFKDPNGS